MKQAKLIVFICIYTLFCSCNNANRRKDENNYTINVYYQNVGVFLHILEDKDSIYLSKRNNNGIMDSARLSISKPQKEQIIDLIKKQMKIDNQSSSTVYTYEGDIALFYIVNKNKRVECRFSNLPCYLDASIDFKTIIETLKSSDSTYSRFFPICLLRLGSCPHEPRKR